MNDDELEHELRFLNPAEPPSALLRRLRASPPPAQGGWLQGKFSAAWKANAPSGWLVYAGVFAVTALLAAAWRTLPSAGFLPARTAPDTLAHTGPSPVAVPTILPAHLAALDRAFPAAFLVAGQRQKIPFDFSRLDGGLQGRYAVSSGQDASAPDGGFNLEAASRPIRLDYGLLAPAADGSEPPFDRLDFSFGQPF